MSNNNIPAVEIVGSFLPPAQLEEAIARKCQGLITDEQLHEIEDTAIDALIDREIEAGLHTVTDGEMRRKAWDRDFWEGFNGIERERIDTGRIYQDDVVRHDLLKFTDRMTFNPEHPFFGKYTHMLDITHGRASVRQTMPSPGELYMRVLMATDGDLSREYPSPDTFIDDIIEAYRLTIKELYRLGCRHIQFDSSVWGRLSDPDCERRLLLGGLDPEAITDTLLHLINSTIADRPADLEITLSIAADATHAPRWNDPNEQRHLTRMLQTVDADAFLLPFDIHSPQQVSALADVPEGKRVILGLVNGTDPGLESVDEIVDFVHAAQTYIPMSLLAISPTNGFHIPQPELQGLDFETQWTKIDLLKRAAAACAE